MADMKKIWWLAGLLDADGCFTIRKERICKSPVIQLCMTDKDTVIKAAKVMDAYRVTEAKHKTSSGKSIYRLNLSGSRAAQWMSILWPILSNRRQDRIEEILTTYNAAPNSHYPNRPTSIANRNPNVVWERGIVPS